MAMAKRARTAETPTLPSFRLMLRAPYFYPTVAADKAVVQRVKVPSCQLPETDT